jgi:hypothetical protein
MRRRHLLRESVILALLGLLAWLMVSNLLRPKQRLGVPTRVNFERVQEGMASEEIAALLGPPSTSFQYYEVWIEDDATIGMWYKDEEAAFAGRRVVFKEYRERPPKPFLERLRHWLPCPRPGVPTKGNFNRVEEGRPPKEVATRPGPPKHQPLGVPTRENFERVREGMTLEEVKAILGPLGTRLIKPGEEEWWTVDAVITVGFSRNHGASKDRRVTYKEYYEFPP